MSCYEKYTDEHQCIKETVETIKVIQKETRKCPGCDIRISKINGCNQMWCVECKTTFDWKTGSKIIGETHNPHYLEYMRTNRALERDANDIPCGGLPIQEYDAISFRHHLPTKLKEQCKNIFLLARFIETRVIPETIQKMNKDEKTKHAYHLLNKEITEKTWKTILYNLKKKREQQQELLSYMRTFLTVIVDSMNSLIVQVREKRNSLLHDIPAQVEIFKRYVLELHEYRMHLNEMFRKMRVKYSIHYETVLNKYWEFDKKKEFELTSEKVSEMDILRWTSDENYQLFCSRQYLHILSSSSQTFSSIDSNESIHEGSLIHDDIPLQTDTV